MKKLTCAVVVLLSSVNSFASECELNSRWDILNAEYASQIGIVRVGDELDIRQEYTHSNGVMYNVYLVDGKNERLLCGAPELSDVITTELGQFTVGSYPRVSCTFYDGGELKQFTAALVKNGRKSAQECGQSFYGNQPNNQWFQFNGNGLADSCYSNNACAIYWNVRSLDDVINEDDGSGSGGNDGGTGGGGTT